MKTRFELEDDIKIILRDSKSLSQLEDKEKLKIANRLKKSKNLQKT
jgi:hypothetical protein